MKNPPDKRPAPKFEVHRSTPPLGPEKAGASVKHYIDDRGSQTRSAWRDRQRAVALRLPGHHGGGDEAA